MMFLSRRTTIISSLGLAVSALSACRSPNQDHTKQLAPQKTFILVHGAWHGGWCWYHVRRYLEDQGHRVFTPTLTGLGERSHFNSRDVNLTTHVTDIVNVIRYENLEDVILVGHSYAGFVVSLVADAVKEKLSKLVYLDAALPVNGQAFFRQEQHANMLEKYGQDYVLPVGTLKFLGIPETHERAAWVKANLTPHPLGTFLEPVAYKNEGVEGIPKVFIRCLGSGRYKDGDPVKTKISEQNDWKYLTLETGHDAMVTAPEETAHLFLSVA